MPVYVLHFEPAFKHARHYVGWTPDADVTKRVEEHRSGQGSPLVRAALAAGSEVLVAHVFDAPGVDRGFERNLKDRKDVKKWCGFCGLHHRPIPTLASVSTKFKARKRT